jgi:GMP synthase (glutamine-hydrolysing)
VRVKVLGVGSHRLSQPGYLWDSAAEAGIEIDFRVAPDGETLPERHDDHDGLLILGGAMGACDDDEYPHLKQAMGLILQFYEHEKPILGICLGAQLIARAFGKPVFPHLRPEAGYYPIHLTAQAHDDPLASKLKGETFLMQFRQDTFELPGGAVRLMTDDVDANQGFRLGPTTYGFQPHFEAAPEFSRQWLAMSPDFVEETRPGLVASFDDQVAAYDAEAREFCLALGHEWMTLVRRRAERDKTS